MSTCFPFYINVFPYHTLKFLITAITEQYIFNGGSNVVINTYAEWYSLKQLISYVYYSNASKILAYSFFKQNLPKCFFGFFISFSINGLSFGALFFLTRFSDFLTNISILNTECKVVLRYVKNLLTYSYRRALVLYNNLKMLFFSFNNSYIYSVIKIDIISLL